MQEGSHIRPDLPQAMADERAKHELTFKRQLPFWFLAGIVLESFAHIPAFESSGSGSVHNQLSQHGKHVIV